MFELDPDFMKFLAENAGPGGNGAATPQQKSGILGGLLSGDNMMKMAMLASASSGAPQMPPVQAGGIYGGGPYQPFAQPQMSEQDRQKMMMQMLMQAYGGTNGR